MQKSVHEVLESQKNYFKTGESLSYEFRIKQLKLLKQSILNHEQELYQALNQDLGKCETEGYMSEIGFVLNSISEMSKKLKKLMKPKHVVSPLYLFPIKSKVAYDPYGCVLIIGPYNYPVQLVLEPLIGVIAAGNCAIIKPSEMSEHTSLVIKAIIEDVFKPEYIKVFLGEVEMTQSLLKERFDYIFFTGSVGVGKKVMSAAANHLTPLTLELGGKSPVIVERSADIKKTAMRIIWGKLMNAGQTCVAPDYILVDQCIEEKLVEALIESINQLYGLNIKENKDYGKIINERHFKRIVSLIDDPSITLLHGGNYDLSALYIEPTIMKVDRYSKVMAEEIFGPLLPIMTYQSINEAIDYINNNEKPLALYLFTQNNKIKKQILSNTTSGGVSINDTITHLVNTHLPFGGVGYSGMGQYHGIYSFLTFSHVKGVVEKSNKLNLTIAYPPYSDKKLKLIKKIMK